MADTLTLTYDFVKPEVGSSKDTWGDKLNADLDQVDLLLTQAFTGGTPSDIGTINPDRLPTGSTGPYVLKAGDTMTGGLTMAGNLTVANNRPHLYLTDLDASANAQKVHIWNATGQIYFGSILADGSELTPLLELRSNATTGANEDVRISVLDSTTPQANSVVNRARGDVRYLRADTDNTEVGSARIRLTSTSDASETSTGHAFQIGPTSGINLRMDSNEILALNNGVLSGLDINAADVEITCPLTVNGPTELLGGLRLNQGGTNYINSVVATADIVFRFNSADTYRLQATGGNTPDTTGTLLSRVMGDNRYIQGVTAGNGMTGGGTSGTVTVTMGTPGAITDTSTNGVSATTHTHSLSELSVRRLLAEGAVNVLGTYGLCYDSAITGTRTQGSTLGGGNLMFCNADGGERSAALTGTWMIYGRAGGTNDAHRTSLWMKKA